MQHTYSRSTASALEKWRFESSWYFAYGSNMKASSMTDRKIVPIKSQAVEVPGFYLTFDVFGIPFSEPSYASIEAFPEDHTAMRLTIDGFRSLEVPAVCGIAYLLSPGDFHRLLVTEGSGVVYELVEVHARSLPGGRGDVPAALTAYTLKAKRPLRPNGVPSLRYMTLFRDGAEAMGLPDQYREYLRELPSYQKPTPGEEPWGMFVFTYLWRPFLKTLVRLTLVNVDSDGNCPQWVAVLIVSLYQLLWLYHDHIHRRIFCSGDGGKLNFKSVKLVTAKEARIHV